ncbi:hypothetical protein ACFQU7_20645 [Pseudoroseomonas wenyumeiae]
MAAEFTMMPSARAPVLAMRRRCVSAWPGRAYSGWVTGMMSWISGTKAAPARRIASIDLRRSSARWETSRKTIRRPLFSSRARSRRPRPSSSRPRAWVPRLRARCLAASCVMAPAQAVESAATSSATSSRGSIAKPPRRSCATKEQEPGATCSQRRA